MARYFRRKKYCRFTADNVEEIDYKDLATLKQYVTETGRSFRVASPARVRTISDSLQPRSSAHASWRCCRTLISTEASCPLQRARFMTGWVRWLLSRRYRLVILAAVLAPVPLVVIVASALMTLETLYRGPRYGLVSAVAATIAGIPLAWVWGSDPRAWCWSPVLCFSPASDWVRCCVARVSLALAFQGVGLVCSAGALLVALLWPNLAPG